MMRSVGRLMSLGFAMLALPVLLAGATAFGQPAGGQGDARSVEELEARIKDLRDSIASLDRQFPALQESLAGTREALGRTADTQKSLWIVQGLLQPLRGVAPGLSNAGFICAGIALLVVILAWPRVARRLLSLRYPFTVPIKSAGEPGQPLGNAGRWIWTVLLLILLLALSLPVLAQEPAQTPAEQEPAEAEGVREQMEEAVLLIELTPVQRAIRALVQAPEGETVQLRLDEPVLREINDAARRRNHPALLSMERVPLDLSLRRGGFAYHFVLAALYEAEGGDGVAEELEKGVKLLPLIDLETSRAIPFQALKDLIEWLAAYDRRIAARPLVVPAGKLAPDLDALRDLVAAARKLDAVGEAREIIESAVPRFNDIEGVTSLSRIAHENEFRDLALEIIDTNYARFEHKATAVLALVELYHTYGERQRAETLLDALLESASFETALAILDTARKLELSGKAQAAMERAAEQVWRVADLEKLLELAAGSGTLEGAMRHLLARLEKNTPMLSWEVAQRLPDAFGAQSLDTERVSLGCLAAAHAYTAADAEALRPLLETPVSAQLQTIIESQGVKNVMRINDLYALLRYYELGNDPALAATREMLAIQERLRGLDRDEAGLSEENAQRIALRMEMERLAGEEQRKREGLQRLEAELRETRDALAKARVEVVLQFMELLAKAVLIVVGLWIALSRACAAARAASGFRFSHFCWRFMETIGFECCCTVVLLVPGVFLTLLGQDRLKHLHIAELVSLPVAVQVDPGAGSGGGHA